MGCVPLLIAVGELVAEEIVEGVKVPSPLLRKIVQVAGVAGMMRGAA
jgi:hypothetical protein